MACARWHRDHHGSQPFECRGDALPRLSCCWRQPRLARRPGAERPRPQIPGAAAQCRRRAEGDPAGARDLPAHVLRPDLCPPEPDGRRVGARVEGGRLLRGRSPVALPADNRRGHALLRPAQGRKAHRSGRRTIGRALRGNAGDHGIDRHAGLRGLQPRPSGC
ncbi:hypothetical protein D9M72_533580 [compost metagenome]